MRSSQLSLTGPARPAVLASLTRLAAQHGVELVRMVAQQLGSRMVVALRAVHADEAQKETWLTATREFAKEFSLELDERRIVASRTDIVTVSGPRITAQTWAQILAALDGSSCTVRALRQLHQNRDEIRAFEIEIDRQPNLSRRSLYRALTAITTPAGVDIAVQADGLDRTHKRLIVMDMDSTLIQIEVIDELARKHGVVDKVSEITRRAMAGELDFEASLRLRVSMLAGLPETDVMALADTLPLMPGAERMLKTMQRLGAKTAVLSGGFTFAANRLKERLGLDYAYANELEIVDGRLTGKVLGAVVTPERKAVLLQEIAKAEQIVPAQILAVGDGANDGLMLAKAGLGVAFHAKAKLRETADTTISEGGLDRLLYVMGLADDQVDALLENRTGQ